MASLKDDTILIVSPQSWGKMFVSKHHYAIALSQRGNSVYFLNPPDQSLDVLVRIESNDEYPGLKIIHHRLYFPYNLRFHLPGIFHLLMYFQVKSILNKIGKPLDIVWSFDIGNLYPLAFFNSARIKIFHPVDEPLNKAALLSAKGSDVIFSVTENILRKYELNQVPRYLINHGVSGIFLQPRNNIFKKDGIVRVGFSGNLLRKDIDREALLSIIYSNPDIIFECWGSYELNSANLGGDNDLDTIGFIDSLSKSENVLLHGVVPVGKLSSEYARVDVFLICYDNLKDQSGGTNYHKVMEYLSTGKVIVSNNISTYDTSTPLFVMCRNRENNAELPLLFSEVVSSLAEWNSEDKCAARINFASENSYSRNCDLIASILEKEFIFK